MANHYQPSAVLRDNAKGFLNGNYRGTTLVTITFALFNYLSGMLLMNFDGIVEKILYRAGKVSVGAALTSFTISYHLNAVLAAFVGVFTIGSALYYLKIGVGKRPHLSDVFSGYRENFSRNLGVSVFVTLPTILVVYPSSLFEQLYSYTKDVKFLIGALVSSAVALVVAVFVEVSIGLAPFLIADFPELSASEAVKKIWNKMNGHRFRLFKLYLSFVPYVLLAVLSLGIGFLWVQPLIQESLAQFYLDLMNPKKVTGEWERTV